MNASANTSQQITDRFIHSACKRIAENKRVRRSLPIWGRLHVDRQLPFLCVYRKPGDNTDLGTGGLLLGEASYITATGNPRLQRSLSVLVKKIATLMVDTFGSFLVLEIWAGSEEDFPDCSLEYQPCFRITQRKNSTLTKTIGSLEQELLKVRVRKAMAAVECRKAVKTGPHSMPPLLSASDLRTIGCHTLGIEIRPIYRDRTTNTNFSVIHRTLHRGFAKALKKAFFVFTNEHTTHTPPHYTALGRRSVVKAVWSVDQKLADIGNQIDFLLQVTPINGQSAWAYFKRHRFQKVPQFLYRRLPINATLLKRRLFGVPIERIEDPTLGALFQEQQREMDRKLTMLSDIGTRRFLYGSLQMYGDISAALVTEAETILDRISPRTRDESPGKAVNAEQFAERATQEIEFFRTSYPQLKSTVKIVDDLTGLMVSNGNLLIGKTARIPASRVEALLHHEVGTHVLTYINGRAQPFQQLYVGLPAYDALQEGLAVLAEYLVGGMSRPRMRLLAARVVAVQQMINGASFIDVFREIDRTYDFEQRSAFTITMRVFRGGGLTKDAVYLQGLIKLLDYLAHGGDFDTLLVGKIAANHVPMIKELLWRKVLKAPPLRPRYLADSAAMKRLDRVRGGITALELTQRKHQ